MSEPKPLPFEPKGRYARQKAQKTNPRFSAPKPEPKAKTRAERKGDRKGDRKTEPQSEQERPSRTATVGIPQEVSNRMVRRAAVFCGVPTFLGFGSLVVSYIVISRHWLELPNTLVLLVSLGLTGLGVLGLSYGALSASWDTGRVGSLWGGDEFRKNLGYLVAAWRSRSAPGNPANSESEESP
ncbi:MAG: PAM68 family protein [Pseudanabaenaceae cyanobacterium]